MCYTAAVSGNCGSIGPLSPCPLFAWRLRCPTNGTCISSRSPLTYIVLSYLVDSGYQATYPHGLDTTRAYLADWIAQHVHVPQVLSWILRCGGHMHPGLRSKVEAQLSHPKVEIPPRLRYLWTILIDNKPLDRQRFLWSSDLHRRARSDAERERIEEAVENCACSPPSPARASCRPLSASASPSVWSHASAGGSGALATRPAHSSCGTPTPSSPPWLWPSNCVTNTVDLTLMTSSARDVGHW